MLTKRKTIELVQRAERVGVSWITVHGRTLTERASTPVNYETVKLVFFSLLFLRSFLFQCQFDSQRNLPFLVNGASGERTSLSTRSRQRALFRIKRCEYLA